MSERTPALVDRVMPTAVVATIAGVFGLFYAYAVWSAVALTVVRANDILGLNALGWVIMIFGVVFPIIAFAIALALGWRRRAWEFALVLFAGLALSAVFWLNVIAYSSTSSSIYGS